MDVTSITGQQSHTQPNQTTNEAAKARKILVWRDDERMGGKVPVWTTEKTPKQTVTADLNQAAQNPHMNPAFESALGYAPSNGAAGNSEAFGFGDLVDMVNPLHHLPLVGHIYREVTGDQIKPISKIIGGGAFGGAVGAVSGIVDTIVTHETGNSLAGNAVSLITKGDMPRFEGGGHNQAFEEPRQAGNFGRTSADIQIASLGQQHRTNLSDAPMKNIATTNAITPNSSGQIMSPTKVTKAYEEAARTHDPAPVAFNKALNDAHNDTRNHLTKAILAPHEDNQNGDDQSALSPHMASFVQMGAQHKSAPAYAPIADGRTAGTRHRDESSSQRAIDASYTQSAALNNPIREPITRFSFSPLPLLNAQEDMLYHKKGAP
jgi:hypothetical protein